MKRSVYLECEATMLTLGKKVVVKKLEYKSSEVEERSKLTKFKIT